VITEDENLHLCQFNDEEDDCRYFFTYEYVENNQVKVEVQKTKGKQWMLSSLAIFHFQGPLFCKMKI